MSKCLPIINFILLWRKCYSDSYFFTYWGKYTFFKQCHSAWLSTHKNITTIPANAHSTHIRSYILKLKQWYTLGVIYSHTHSDTHIVRHTNDHTHSRDIYNHTLRHTYVHTHSETHTMYTFRYTNDHTHTHMTKHTQIHILLYTPWSHKHDHIHLDTHMFIHTKTCKPSYTLNTHIIIHTQSLIWSYIVSHIW